MSWYRYQRPPCHPPHYCPLLALISLYNSLFSSFHDYGITAWGLTFESYLKPLSRLQKKVLRCIKFEPFSAPSAPTSRSLKILKLEDTLHLNILTFVYKAINKLSPSYFHNFFQLSTTVHKIGTRHATRGAYYRFAASRPRPYFYVRPTDLAVVFLRIATSA